MTIREIQESAKSNAEACADAIQLQYGLNDKQRDSIERMLRHEFEALMRQVRDA